MIRLSNGCEIEYVAASGALGWTGNGWPHEQLLRWISLLKPEIFAAVIKTITLDPRKGNFSWLHPWTCIRLIKGGAVNKVGLTNKGFAWWIRKKAPKIDFVNRTVIGSIYGNPYEMGFLAHELNKFDFAAISANLSCPNTLHMEKKVEVLVQTLQQVQKNTECPVFAKISVDQPYMELCSEIVRLGLAEAVEFNSIPWEIVFPSESPLWRLQAKVGGGGGGVSGIPAQAHNWPAMQKIIAEFPALPVIAPDIMSYRDLRNTEKMGAKAFSFATLFLRAPWAPAQIVAKHQRRKEKNRKRKGIH